MIMLKERSIESHGNDKKCFIPIYDVPHHTELWLTEFKGFCKICTSWEALQTPS